MRWRVRDPYAWRRWFAWHPVIIGGHYVWLECVERRFAAERLETLSQWVAHKHFCGIMGQDNRFAWRDGDEESCDCGLADIMAPPLPREAPGTETP